MPTLNVDLLRRVQKHITAKPRRLVMRYLVVHKNPSVHNPSGVEGSHFHGDVDNQVFADCGTAACIAGWTLILSGREPFKADNEAQNDATTAAKLLGLTYGEDNLFFLCDWPRKFAAPYEKAATATKRAKIAAARIEHLITTGE